MWQRGSDGRPSTTSTTELSVTSLRARSVGEGNDFKVCGG